MLDIERRLNIKFPKEYIDFINNMDAINSKKIILLDEEENILIKNFLSLNEDIEDSIIQVYNEYRSIMLEGVIPIATTEDEDYICLYYEMNRENLPKVILWSYELALDQYGEGMFPVSNSFSEFGKKLIIE